MSITTREPGHRHDGNGSAPAAGDRHNGNGATGRGRPVREKELRPFATRPDGTTALTAVLALLYFIPARLVFAPLGAAGRPAMLLGLVLMAWWALSRLVPSLTRRGRQPMRAALLLYLYVYLVAYMFGVSRGITGLEESSANRAILSVLSLVGIGLMAADGIPNRLRLDKLLNRLTAFGAVMAFLGELQFLFGIDLVSQISIPGLSLNADLIGIAERGNAGLRRVAGTAAHYIEFGVVAAMLLPIAIHYALHAADRGQRQRRWLIVAVIGAAVPFSISRSGFVALGVIAITLGLIWNMRFQMQAAVVGLGALALLRAAVPGLLGTIMSLFQNFGNDPSIQNRQADYPIVFRYIAERPIFGRGPGTFTPERYILLDNEILMTLAQTGYVGLVVFFSLFAVAVFQCRSVAKHTSDPESRHLAQALMASVLGGLVASFTFDSLSFVTFATTLFLMFGAIGALWRLDREAGGDLPLRQGHEILKPNRLLRSRSRQAPSPT